MLTVFTETPNSHNNIKLKSSKDEVCSHALDSSLRELKKLFEKDMSEVSKIKW